jgi:hypothetical protein
MVCVKVNLQNQEVCVVVVSRISSSVRVVEQVGAEAWMSVVGKRVVVMVKFCMRKAVGAERVERTVWVIVENWVRGAGVEALETIICVTVVSWVVVRRLSWVMTAVGTGSGSRVETIVTVMIWVMRSVGAARTGRVETSVSVRVMVCVV